MNERRCALLIASYQYDDPNLSQLIAPPKDVSSLAQVLQDSKIGYFDEVKTVINQPYITVRDEIARFFDRKKRNDLLLLYFSGHGLLDDRGRLYLAVKDTQHNLLRARSIRAYDITDEMDQCRSRRQILILDCCHSGAFDRSKAASRTSIGTENIFEGSGYGRVVLAASDVTQYAWEGDQAKGEPEHSLFTHYLIEGLHTGSADANQDGKITIDEWYDYAYEQVIQTAKQTPGKWSYKEQGEIIIACNPNPIFQASESPDEIAKSIQSSEVILTRLVSEIKMGEEPELRHQAAIRLVKLDSKLCAQQLNTMLKSKMPLERRIALDNVAYIQVTEPSALNLEALDLTGKQNKLFQLRWKYNSSAWKASTFYSALGGTITCVIGSLVAIIFFEHPENLEQFPMGVMFALMAGSIFGGSIGFSFSSIEAIKGPGQSKRFLFYSCSGTAIFSGIVGMVFGAGDVSVNNILIGSLIGLAVGVTSGGITSIIINKATRVKTFRKRLLTCLALALVASIIPAKIFALAARLGVLPLEVEAYGFGLGFLLLGTVGGLEYAQYTFLKQRKGSTRL